MTPAPEPAARRAARLTDFADANARQGDWSEPLRRALAALPPGGGDVYLPGGEPYSLGSPVLIARHNVRLIGDGPAASVLFGGRGGLRFSPPSAVPDARAWYSPNPAGGLQIRPGSNGSVVFVGTPADQSWADVRRFTIDAWVVVTPGRRGAWCGMASQQWDGTPSGEYQPCPWLLLTTMLEPGKLRVKVTLDDYTMRDLYVPLPNGGDGEQRVRVSLDLDAGDAKAWAAGSEVPVADRYGRSFAGCRLLENPGVPFRVGNTGASFGGITGEGVNRSDLTVRGLRVTKDLAPEPLPVGPQWTTHTPGTAFYLLLDGPRAGEEPTAVAWGGADLDGNGAFGAGWAVTYADGWLQSPRLQEIGVHGYGRTGVNVLAASLARAGFRDVAFSGGAVGLWCGAVAAPSYPVRIRDCAFDHHTDAGATFNRASKITMTGVDFVTGNARSALRASNYGLLVVTDAFVNPGQQGAASTEDDFFWLESGATAALDQLMVDYEDGYGPRRANVAVCGAKLDLYDSVTSVTRSVFGRVLPGNRPDLPAGGWSDVRRGHGLPANAVVTVDGVAAAVPTPGPKEVRRDR